MIKILGALLVFGVGTYYFWTQFGVETKKKPKLANVDDIKVPDISDSINKTADTTQDTGNEFIEFLMDISPKAWAIIIAAVVAGIVVTKWNNSAKFKYITIGIIVAIIGLVILTGAI